jgi:hypothetical protein
MLKDRGYDLAILFIAFIFVLAGCQEKATQVATIDARARETEVYQTVIAQFTQDAVAFTQTLPPVAPPTIEIVLPTLTAIPPTPTNVPVEPTPTTQVTPTTRPETGGVRLWWDDFEGEKNWFTGEKEDSYTFEFTNGAYRVYNNLLGSIVWSIRGDNYIDVRVEVDAMKQKGPKDGYFGLICRYVDSKNYYALVISYQGTFGIVKMEKSKINFIQEGELPAKLLKAKEEYNHIRADCIGTSLVLYVNDKKVTEIQDSSFTSGDVGIGVGNQLEDTGIDVIFDNFEIWQP